jgi:YVTN family beta-propeller protein
MSPGLVSVIDIATRQEIARVPAGPGAHGVVAGPDGTRLFVTDQNGATLDVLNAQQRQVTNQVAVGSGPNGIAYAG